MDYRLTRTLGGDGTEPRRFASGLRGLAVDSDGRIYAVGGSRVEVFDSDGVALRRWSIGRDGYSVAVGSGKKVWVGQAGQIEVFDASGTLVDTWSDGERLGLVTAIGFTAGGVLAADAVARWIRHYDRQGTFRNNIGEKHRKGGFHIPNGVVDFAVDAEGVIHVANSGMHRVERYTPEGELLGYVGRFGGGDPERFPRRGTDVTFPRRGTGVTFSGCCNPTNLALAEDGRMIVTEKAPPRVKIYDPAGRLLAVVAAPAAFDPGAKNMDVAAAGDRIYVADPVRRQICVFEPAGNGEAGT